MLVFRDDLESRWGVKAPESSILSVSATNIMHFLLQKNIWDEYGYDRFVQSIKDFGISHQIVGLIPFTDTFIEEVTAVPDMAFGSTRFINVCRAKGYHAFPTYYPNAFEMFDPEYWINGSNTVTTFGELNITKPSFLKPFTEKFFTGVVVYDNSDLEKIQLSTSFTENENDEFVSVSDVVNIDEEIRYYIIGGQIITGSGYKTKGRGNHFPVDQSHDSYHACKNILCNARSNELDDGFVLDIGKVGDEWKIVELNNLNSSGLYKCNTDAIVNALVNYERPS